jgi:hypothetical protein
VSRRSVARPRCAASVSSSLMRRDPSPHPRAIATTKRRVTSPIRSGRNPCMTAEFDGLVGCQGMRLLRTICPADGSTAPCSQSVHIHRPSAAPALVFRSQGPVDTRIARNRSLRSGHEFSRAGRPQLALPRAARDPSRACQPLSQIRRYQDHECQAARKLVPARKRRAKALAIVSWPDGNRRRRQAELLLKPSSLGESRGLGCGQRSVDSEIITPRSP